MMFFKARDREHLTPMPKLCKVFYAITLHIQQASCSFQQIDTVTQQ